MEIAAGSLLGHLMNRHGKAAPRRHLCPPQTTGGPRTYKINFPQGSRRQCPVEGCPGVSETRAAMRVHFMHRHVHDTVVILEEGNLPLPRCPRCDLQVSRRALNGRHLGTNQCRTGAERKIRRLAAAEGGGSDGEGFQRLREEVKLGEGVPLPREGLNRHRR